MATSATINHDLLTNAILLNVCSFFEIFCRLDPKLLPHAAVSPKDILDECTPNTMSPSLNELLARLLHFCKPNAQINQSSKYLPNDELIQLLFHELQQREDEFILHCPRDEEFDKMSDYKQDGMDIDMNAKQENDEDENGIDDEMHNEYGISWQRVEYAQLPILYRLSILQNLCDWILSANKAMRKLMNSNKKTLVLQPEFVDDDGTKYYIVGYESLQQCLYRQCNDDKKSMKVYDCEEYEFEDKDKLLANNGTYFGNFEFIGIGIQGIKEFLVKIDAMKQQKLYYYLISKIQEMELFEKKKLRQERRRRMRQLTFEQNMANPRRSTRIRG